MEISKKPCVFRVEKKPEINEKTNGVKAKHISPDFQKPPLPKPEKEKNFHEIFLKLEKAGTNKIDPAIHKELFSAIHKTQQEQIKISESK